MEVQAPSCNKRLTLVSGLNLSILIIIHLFLDFSEGQKFGVSFILEIIFNLILLINIFISVFFGKQFSDTIRFILGLMTFVLFLTVTVFDFVCFSPQTKGSLIGVYIFVICMRIAFLLLYFICIVLYLYKIDEKNNK